MRKALILLSALLCFGMANARESEMSPAGKAQEALPTLPEYAYCEIVGNHLPSLNGNEVLFDFGQPTEYWRQNWLRGSRGEKLIFNSVVEALNYMVARNWEFVQAYTSGEKNEKTHLLLRIQTANLPEALRQQLLTQPRSKADKKTREEL